MANGEREIDIKLTYDPDSDAAYIHFQWPPDKEKLDNQVTPYHLGDKIMLDRFQDGRIAGIKILGARGILPESLLKAIESIAEQSKPLDL